MGMEQCVWDIHCSDNQLVQDYYTVSSKAISTRAINNSQTDIKILHS